MKQLIKFGCWMMVMCVFAASAWGQNVATANLSGTVKDPSGAAIKNAKVTVRDDSTGLTRTATTDEEGLYQFLALPPATYRLTVEAAGFANLAANNIKLAVGQSGQVPISMRIAATTEVATVSAETQTLETQQTVTSTTISQLEIDNLPINGRNYLGYALTNSQVARDVAPSIGAAPTSGVNFSGGRARANLVNVDGADAIDNSTNGVRSTVSQEAVQEFQIATNGYAPEYGRASGGVVNIVTRRGKNDFHGSAYSYLRNRYIQATNPFSNVNQPAYTRVQPGVTFSGPLKKDKTFFFLSWEGTFRQETGFSTIGSDNFGLVSSDVSKFFGAPNGVVVIQATPQQAAFFAATPAAAPGVASYAGLVGRASGMAVNGIWPAALGAQRGFPTSCLAPPCVAPVPTAFVPLSSLIGNYPVTEHTNVYSLRLDHHLTDKHDLIFRANASPSAVSGIQVNAQNQNFGQNAFSRTSDQNYHDMTILGQDTWTISPSQLNEFRYQFARRGLRYDFSQAAGGSNPAVNIGGFAFFGREPFSFVNRVEKRNQFTDNFSWLKGNHFVKFGADFNYLPLQADFTVNFGGVYNFGIVNASDLGLPSALPGFNAAQAYGLGIPQVFIQGVGNPHDEFANKTLGFYLQDSWRLRPNLTLNYGVRYDVEFTPTFPAINAGSQAAQDALGITQGIPRDTNNIAPRIGLAWSVDKKTVVRSSFGMFYDHPLLALAFDSDVADATQAPQLVFFGGAPTSPAAGCNINATNIFQGLLNCPAGFGYLPNEQRFNASLPNSVFVNQNYLSAGVPLVMQPFGFPTAKNFVYAYTEQANLTVEHDFGHDLDLSVAYNYSGGHHLNRPINVNPVHADLLSKNFLAAAAAGVNSATTTPLSEANCGVGPAGPYIPAALVSFFRPSGLNPSLVPVTPAPCLALVNSVLQADGLGLGVSVPFSDDPTNFSNGSSVYHGLTTNLRKRFNANVEFLASYTWSHSIDDSTDLQSLLTPQDDRNPSAERSNSTFDQRHRFVLSGVYQSGKSGEGFTGKVLSNWTLAPIIEISSGRPFNILTGTDRNFNFSTNTDRPLIVPAGTGTNACGDPVVASTFSPTGLFQLPCFLNGTFNGNLGRNSGTRPYTVFTDLRVGRGFPLGDRVRLEGTMDVFNLINRFNVADVNPLFTNAGQPSAAFDPRQFQFGLKLSF